MNLSDLEGKAAEIVRCYEYPKAAMLPLLWLVQQNQGYISPEAEAWVGAPPRSADRPRARGGLLLQHVPDQTRGPARAAGLHEFALRSARRRGTAGPDQENLDRPGETTPTRKSR